MKKYIIIMLLAAMALYIQAGQTSHVVTGKIVDHDTGEALLAVNVVEKGTKNGTITDEKGNFQLTVRNAYATLVISMIGYGTQEWKLEGKQVINVKLKSEPMFLENLEEMISIDYNRKENDATRIRTAGNYQNVSRPKKAYQPVQYEPYPQYLQRDRVQQDFNTEGYDY
ncbi:MAG: carboxypeptidase-like regulatory domain-containing protein, partial [Cyclobacteriaceae bacterium]